MSMSQEEIEALMSGIEAEEETPAVEENIPELEEISSNEPVTAADIDALLTAQNEVSEIEDNLDQKIEEEDINQNSEAQIDDILNSLDITDTSEDSIIESLENNSSNINESAHEDIGKNWAENKIEKGMFPFPVDKDTQVVNQLSQVAEDSEEKASQIFDVLSLVLDNNDIVSKEIKPLAEFLKNQIVLLETLNSKFPNVPQFKENLDIANSLKTNPKTILDNLDAENMEIFGAMELMQFNDINRQKIERVMSVIRKLSSYLNNLFEDDNSHKEIVVAKHIAGDSNSEAMDADDIESLIDSYSK